jgi:integrase
VSGPHDFRRMFATEAGTGGLPVHIAARLLGHHNRAATQALYRFKTNRTVSDLVFIRSAHAAW